MTSAVGRELQRHLLPPLARIVLEYAYDESAEQREGRERARNEAIDLAATVGSAWSAEEPQYRRVAASLFLVQKLRDLRCVHEKQLGLPIPPPIMTPASIANKPDRAYLAQRFLRIRTRRAAYFMDPAEFARWNELRLATMLD
jgi:hypothetical protein